MTFLELVKINSMKRKDTAPNAVSLSVAHYFTWEQIAYAY